MDILTLGFCLVVVLATIAVFLWMTAPRRNVRRIFKIDDLWREKQIMAGMLERYPDYGGAGSLWRDRIREIDDELIALGIDPRSLQ